LQHAQVHSAGSQAQTPVTQQPQQSQAVAQAQGLLAAETVATAMAPVITRASKEANKNLNMKLTPNQKQ